MKTFLNIIIFLLLGSMAHAQKNFFIYIQTDNKQPFYVKVNNKLVSSSAAGYLIVSKLTTGDYPVTVGFPKDQWPQQTFNITIADKDIGYLLKNFGEKGWGLYNMQTMEISMNGKPATKQKAITENDDAFASTLSGATNADISVKKTQVKTETPEKPIQTEVVKPVKNVSKKAISKVEKIKTANDEDGKSMVYVINTNDRLDTVTVFIPYQLAKPKVEEKVKEPAKQAVVKKDTKFLDIEMTNPNTKTDEPVNEPVKTEVAAVKQTEPKKFMDKPTVTFNSDCRAFATDDDFFKTRKKMVAEDSDDAMIEAARKMFKTKCYTVEQVKNLSLLFLNDNGKYNFFDAAYPHTSDSQNFIGLQSELKDDYYIKRFKAMLRN
jgi:hypothetical protein